jgi:hypothetical protein
MLESTETVESTDNTEVVSPEAEAAAPSDAFDIDALIAANFDNDEVMKDPTAEHRIGKPYHEVLKHIPEDGRKVIQNLRASYTRKTQELATMKADLEKQKGEMIRQQKLMTESEWAKNIKNMADDNTEHDIWDEEGRKASIKKEAAKMMAEMMKPLQDEVAQERRAMELAKFKSENPDMQDLRVEIAALLMERQDLKLEDAYYLVKGKRSIEVSKQAAQAKASERETARAGISKIASGKNVDSAQLSAPQFKSAWDAYQYHKSMSTTSKK